MPRYDTKCESCNKESIRSKSFDEQKSGDTVEKDPCECGGRVSIIIKSVNLSSDATPTRGYGRSSNAPNLVGKDGKPVNVGHTGVTASMLGLNSDQCNRLGL